MNERVRRLRQASLDARPHISTERAEIMTDFYQRSREQSAPVRRALAFKQLMEEKALWIGEDELIVAAIAHRDDLLSLELEARRVLPRRQEGLRALAPRTSRCEPWGARGTRRLDLAA